MRIAILDDDTQEMNEISDALRGWDESREAELFNSGEKLIESAKRLPHYTVVFLDIYLPKENGIEIAKQFREISPETEIVFTTTSREHAIDAFSLNALHYLVKPITTKDIREVFERITKKQKIRHTIYIQVGKNSQLLYLDEIAKAESRDHKMLISMMDGTEYETYMKCSDLQEMLGKDFLLVQRGELVNADYIRKMNADSCVLKNGQTILLSRKDKVAIRNAYHEYVFRRVSNETDMEV